jgi:hypothetical protein
MHRAMPANFEPVSERQLPNQGRANSDSWVRWVTEEKLLWKSSLCRPSTGLAAVPRTITCTCTRFTRSLKVLPVSCTDTSVLLGCEAGVSAADFCWSGFLRALSARRSSRQKQNHDHFECRSNPCSVSHGTLLTNVLTIARCHVACPKAGAIERVETNAMFRLQRLSKSSFYRGRSALTVITLFKRILSIKKVQTSKRARASLLNPATTKKRELI